MAFPRKFQQLLELDRASKSPAPQAWLTYSVCGVQSDACGWHGWVLEAVCGTSERTVGPSHLEPGAYDGSCPNCGAELFRTAATYRFEPASDQTEPRRVGIDYDTSPLEFED